MKYKEVFAEIIKDAFKDDLAEWYIDVYFNGNTALFADEFRKEFGTDLINRR